MLLLISLPLAHVTALRTLGFVVAALCAVFLYFSPTQNQPRTLPLFWVFLLWLAAALLSLVSSPNVEHALAIIWNEVIKSALIFYVAYFLARARQHSVSWFFSAATALSLLAAVSIAYWLLLESWQAKGPVPALGDYNTSALTLLPLTALPAFTHWRQRLGTAAPTVAVLTSILAMTASVLTMSRSFWLVSAVMLTILTAAWSRRKQRHSSIPILWISGGLCLLALVATLVARWRGLDLLFFETRSVIYGPVLDRLQSAPITGFGYGHESSQDWYREHMVEVGVLHAHNIVLSYIEQMGMPGLLAILGIFGGFSFRFFRKISDNAPSQASLAAIGLALVAGVFVKNNLDIFFTRHNLLLFFLCCGLLLGSIEAEETLSTKHACE